MKTTIKIEKEVEIKKLEVRAEIRHWEDGEVNGEEDEVGDLMPCRNGSLWCPMIDIEEGIILNWGQGKTAKVHYKVCDSGSYFLIDEKENIVASIENNYVPKMLCPEGVGYGDYIIMNINENGKIENWKIDISEFLEE